MSNTLWLVFRDLHYEGISDCTFVLFDTKEDAQCWIESVEHLVDYGELKSKEIDASNLTKETEE